MNDGALLRALAHQMRNALAPIVSATHLLRLRANADPAIPGIVSIIERQVAAMLHALDAVVDAERLVRGELALVRQRIDLGSVIEAAVEDTRALIEARGQQLRFATGQDPVWVDGDPARLAQALAHILDNAARYTGEGGDIMIEVVTGESEVEIVVRDTGRGIAPDRLAQLFDAGSPRPRSDDRLGLGLVIARGLCSAHGGRLVVKSEGEGRGTSVVVTLPMAAGERQAAPPKRPPPVSPDAKRILVVEDNSAVRDVLASVLQEQGHEVRSAADGEQALAVVEQWAPQVALLDIYMPKINGFGLARRLRERFPPDRLQLVMMSGADLDPTTLHAAKEVGFDHCIGKADVVKGLEALLRGDIPSL